MFPIRDHNPSSRTPWVTYTLIAINVAVFLSYWGLMDQPRVMSVIYARWALIPAIADQAPLGFVTSMFLHGGLMHLAGNMLFLWIFVDNLEDELGPLRYLGFYLASGVLASLAHVLSAPDSPVPLVGASGAIAGVMGGYLLLFPRAKVDVLFIFVIFFKIWPLPAWVVLGAWFGLQLFSGAALLGSGVAYWAHVGGFIAGLVLCVPVWLRRGGPRYWQRTHGHPPHAAAQYRRTSVPTVPRR